MKGLAIIAFMLLMLAATVSAATIYGTIYDYSLDKAKDARVEVNTEPKQVYISKNGSYAFNIPNGIYQLEAKQYVGGLLKASTSENITIKDEGSYILDLILFPGLEEDELEEDIEINDPFEKKKLNLMPLLIIILLLVIVFFIYAQSKKRISIKKGEEKIGEKYEDLEEIIKIIKQEGGRTTQKYLRKQIPLSEAKISLMIDELEHRGMIEKIKKGRGNIIILKK